MSRRLLMAAAFASIALVPSLQAQQPDTTKKAKPAADSARTLPTIEVVGSIQPAVGLNVGSGIPARITTLTGKQVDAMEPRILSDVLQQQAGFATYDDLGSPYKLNVSSRGFYASPVVGLPQGISVFLDGVRMNEPDAAQVNFDLLPMEHIKRIEILSGNGSLLGRNSLGGAINLVTDHGEGPMHGELEAMGGMYGSYSGEGNLSGQTAGGLDYYIGGGYNHEDGWRQATSAKQYNGFLNVGKLGTRKGIRLQLLGAKGDAQTAGSLPETVYDVRPDSNLSANDYEHLWQLQAAVLGYTTIGRGRASFNTYVRRHSADRFNANQVTDPDSYGESRNTVYGGTADYTWSTPVGHGGAVLGLRVGVDASGSSTKVDLFIDSTKFDGGRTVTTRVSSPIWDAGGFASADLSVGRVTFSAGGRYDYVKAPFRNLLDPTRDTTQTFKRFNPRAGIDVNVGGGIGLFGSWGRAFRAPSVIEIACADPEEPCPLPFALGDDPPINAVKTETFEAGFRARRGVVNLSASAYRTNVKDDIFLFPFTEGDEPSGSTIDGFFGNVAETRREGIEAGLAAAPLRTLSLYANYAYTKATFQVTQDIFSVRANALGIENEVEPGDRLPLVPAHQVKGGFTWSALPFLELGADARYIGRQYLRGDEANDDTPLSGYFVADSRLKVTTGPWEVAALVTNVFNNTYAVFGTYNINQGNPNGPTLERFLTPGYRRQFRLVVRRSFGGPDQD